MTITKYSKLTPAAIFRTLRIDYGKNKRLEFTYSFLLRKGDAWHNEDKTKCKPIQLDNKGTVKQLGLYIGRLAIVGLNGTVEEGM